MDSASVPRVWSRLALITRADDRSAIGPELRHGALAAQQHHDAVLQCFAETVSG